MRKKNKELQSIITEGSGQLDSAISIDMKSEKKPKKVKSKKKKKIIRRVVIAAVIVVILGVTVLPGVLAGPTLNTVTTTQALNGDIEAKLNLSGIVTSEVTRTYFSPVNSNIGSVDVVLGQAVEAGQAMITYDTTTLENSLLTAQLTDQMNAATYQSVATENQKAKDKLAQAEADIAVYDPLIDQQKQYIKDLEAGINDSMITQRTDLYAALRKKERTQADLQDQLKLTPTNELVMDQINNVGFEIDDLTRKITQLSTEYKTPDKREDILLKAKNDLTDMDTLLTEAKAKKSAAEAAVLNGSELEAKRLQNEISSIATESDQSKLEAAKAGVTADFSGVVTDLTAVQGASVQSGTQLLTLQSNENVKVKISVSKYDLERLQEGQTAKVVIADKTYDGVVSTINRFAVANTSGTPMVSVDVHITNPDESIFLGLEAKVNIDLAQASGVLLVPIEAVNADKQGDFCYVVENGIVVRKNVTVGISSDMFVEIKEGLSVGDHVINTGITVPEGTQVTEVEEN